MDNTGHAIAGSTMYFKPFYELGDKTRTYDTRRKNEVVTLSRSLFLSGKTGGKEK